MALMQSSGFLDGLPGILNLLSLCFMTKSNLVLDTVTLSKSYRSKLYYCCYNTDVNCICDNAVTLHLAYSVFAYFRLRLLRVCLFRIRLFRVGLFRIRLFRVCLFRIRLPRIGLFRVGLLLDVSVFA